MATRKDYTLIGVGASVQYGKGGGSIRWNTDRFESTSDGVTLAQLRVPTLPINDNDAASKIYVDNMAAGLDAKDSARAATTVAGTLLTSFSAGSTIDGVVLVAGDRILIKNQASAIENGIYDVTAGAPVRAIDADTGLELNGGSFIFVEEGTTLADTGWVVSSDGPVTIGVSNIDWVQFSAAGVITAGIGLTQTGTIFDVNIGATTITVDGTDDLIVNSSATPGQVLISAGVIGSESSWGAVDLANTNAITGLLPKINGGLNTDISAFADGSLIVTDNTNNDVNELTVGTNGNALIVTGGLPVWGRIDLSDGANSVVNILTEPNGGTGLGVYTQGDILVSDAANSLATLPLGTLGQTLQSDGTDAIWGAPLPASGSVVTITGNITFNGGASQALGSIPAGGRVIKVSVDITTAWDATETIEIGDAGLISRLMVASANDPEQAFIFSTDTNYTYVGATPIIATVSTANGATTGAGSATIQFIQP